MLNGPLVALAVLAQSPGTPSDEARPKIVLGGVGFTLSGRSFCTRPGVSSCAQYDQRVAAGQAPPPGDTVDSGSSGLSGGGYGGGAVWFEILPLAWLRNPANGIGVGGGFSQGGGSFQVQKQGAGGGFANAAIGYREFTSDAALFYRFHFSYAVLQKSLLGWVGPRLAVFGHGLEYSPPNAIPVPQSHRPLYGGLGLDAAAPAFRFLRLEASFLYFPSPGPPKAEADVYGKLSSTTGFQVEAGVAGDLWGPIGYAVRYRWTSFKDVYSGQSFVYGWSNGGVVEEAYQSLLLSITGSY